MKKVIISILLCMFSIDFYGAACLSVISFSESNQPLTISGQIKILSA